MGGQEKYQEVGPVSLEGMGQDDPGTSIATQNGEGYLKNGVNSMRLSFGCQNVSDCHRRSKIRKIEYGWWFRQTGVEHHHLCVQYERTLRKFQDFDGKISMGID